MHTYKHINCEEKKKKIAYFESLIKQLKYLFYEKKNPLNFQIHLHYYLRKY